MQPETLQVIDEVIPWSDRREKILHALGAFFTGDVIGLRHTGEIIENAIPVTNGEWRLRSPGAP
jgi:hypothetical protein